MSDPRKHAWHYEVETNVYSCHKCGMQSLGSTEYMEQPCTAPEPSTLLMEARTVLSETQSEVRLCYGNGYQSYNEERLVSIVDKLTGVLEHILNHLGAES